MLRELDSPCTPYKQSRPYTSVKFQDRVLGDLFRDPRLSSALVSRGNKKRHVNNHPITDREAGYRIDPSWCRALHRDEQLGSDRCLDSSMDDARRGNRFLGPD
jgi:hypothetical protein